MNEHPFGRKWAAEMAEELSGKGVAVFSIDGTKVLDKETFLEAFAKGLRFPDYFGKNWDAFEDCMRDLEWLEAKGLLVLYRNSGPFRDSCPGDWAIASGILLDAIDFWKERHFPMAVLFT